MAEPAEAFHPSEFIRAEMEARSWTARHVALAMPGDYGTNLLALEMYLEIGPRDPGLRLGSMADDLAFAFGTSAELWRNLESAWLRFIERAATPDGGRDG